MRCPSHPYGHNLSEISDSSILIDFPPSFMWLATLDQGYLLNIPWLCFWHGNFGNFRMVLDGEFGYREIELRSKSQWFELRKSGWDDFVVDPSRLEQNLDSI